jgi:cytosine/adenosine deaminase-related metal-dependent hydrolase
VSRGGLERAARFAAKDELPLHAHVSEQRGEVRQCLEEHGLRPVELFAEAGAVGPRFVAVHATHLEPREAQLLGQAGAFACICRTTERDLGDGLADVATLVEHGARLCTGVDSHAISDPFEEARAIELDDRSRAEARTVAAEAPALLAAASSEGYAALGLDHAFDEDRVVLDAEDPSLALASPDALADAVVFGTTPRAVKRVEVAGRIVVDEGMLTASADDWPAIRRHAEAAMKRLGLM